jgi:hypothetical protein
MKAGFGKLERFKVPPRVPSKIGAENPWQEPLNPPERRQFA